MEFTYALRFRFNAINNEAEYEALIAGLRIARQMGVQNLQANMDSKLVANQVNGVYVAKESSMIKYLEKVKNLASTLQEFSIKQVPKGENKKASALSKITSTSFAHLSKQVLVEELREKSIDKQEILAVVEEEGHTWMTPVHEYLMEGILPEEKKARVIHRKAGRYKHALGPKFVVAKALRLGYYWPTMHTNAKNLIRACNDCQVYRLMPRNPQEKLTPIMSPWPFYKWGIDIARPFLEGPSKVKFGLPGEIVSDNKKQFRDNPFKDWCEKLSIRQCFAFVKHPQTNGLVERANKSLREGIKGRLEAVILVEIGMPTLRTEEVDMIKNNEDLGINLDLLEEKREQEAIQEAKRKAKIEKYYNARVRSTSFRLGDFVYWNNEASHAEDGGKLEPKWEGPYEVTEALGRGA
ncbi:reverse transcriptase domain-containing protein [Tanacetum coccineum]